MNSKLEFCKVFNSKTYGQMLVIIDSDPNTYPAVAFKFAPKGLGVSTLSYPFEDEDEVDAWDKADELYASFDFAKCEALAEEITGITIKMADTVN